MWNDASLVSSLRLLGDTLIIKSTACIGPSEVEFNLSDLSIELKENDPRTDRYFLITHLHNKKKYVVILTDDSYVDLKTLVWFSNNKCNLFLL